MKKPLYYNITYAGKVIHKRVSEDESQQILLTLAEKAADGKINMDLIDMEVI